MIKTTITASGSKLDLNKLFNSALMLKIGNIIKALTLGRTRSGKDYLLKQFIAYAKSNKKKYGKTVDLNQSGQMLASISVKAYVKKVIVYLNNRLAIQKAMWNETKKNYNRKFWGLSSPILQKIDTFIKDLFKRNYSK